MVGLSDPRVALRGPLLTLSTRVELARLSLSRLF